MRSVIVAAVVLAAVAPARGQCYRTSGCSYPVQTYHAPTYYQPTYAATVQYAPHYESYTQTAVVGAAYPVYLPLLSYTALSDDVRSYYSQKRATKDAYLEALREAAAEGIFGTAQPPPPQPFTPPPGVERSGLRQLPGAYDERTGTPLPQNPDGSIKSGLVPAIPNPGTPPAVPKAPGTSPQIGKLLQTRCASCHNPKDGPERVDLSMPADRITSDVRSLAVVWCADGSMPQKGEKLSQAEFDSLQAWAKAARPVVAKIPPAQPADKK